MAKTKRELIFATCILSGLAVVLQLTALGTEQWIVSDGRIDQEGPSTIQYGLFSGTFRQSLGGMNVYQITSKNKLFVFICFYH